MVDDIKKTMFQPLYHTFDVFPSKVNHNYYFYRYRASRESPDVVFSHFSTEMAGKRFFAISKVRCTAVSLANACGVAKTNVTDRSIRIK